MKKLVLALLAGWFAIPAAAAPPPPALTPRALQYMYDRFKEHVDHATRDAAPPAALAAHGLSSEADAVERVRTVKGVKIAPTNVDLAVRDLDGPRIAIDPAVSMHARDALLGRLGREPTAAELTSEIAAYDARIKKLNHELLARRAAYASSVRTTGALTAAQRDEIRTLWLPATTIPSTHAPPTPAQRRSGTIAALIELINTRALDPW